MMAYLQEWWASVYSRRITIDQSATPAPPAPALRSRTVTARSREPAPTSVGGGRSALRHHEGLTHCGWENFRCVGEPCTSLTWKPMPQMPHFFPANRCEACNTYCLVPWWTDCLQFPNSPPGAARREERKASSETPKSKVCISSHKTFVLFRKLKPTQKNLKVLHRSYHKPSVVSRNCASQPKMDMVGVRDCRGASFMYSLCTIGMRCLT